jgi:hypothetical protein
MLGEDLGIDKAAVVRRYECRCRRPIFFRNTVCLACHSDLGYDPKAAKLLPIDRGDGETWTAARGGRKVRYRTCVNRLSPSGCNWLIDERDSNPLCQSCRLNRTIPDLSVAQNAEDWMKVEMAKRRLVSALIGLGLPVRSRVSEDAGRGLAFDLLRPTPGGPAVITGHAGGIITLNIDEADDAVRELHRRNLNEPYRTLLGHLRHEVGHYYWDLLVANSPLVEGFRELFGDERDDYNGALQRHYNEGPRLDWREQFVSAYATSHPWEDWAETWAHYLHIADTWDTALSFGLDLRAGMKFDGFTPSALAEPHQPGGDDFLSFLNAWTQLTTVMNELSRAMGLQDFYPFVLSQRAVAKLHFVHLVVRGQ